MKECGLSMRVQLERKCELYSRTSGQQCLTCDKYVDEGLSLGFVLVSAAELAGVLSLAAAHCQTAAVMLPRPPTARFLHSHLICGQT